MYRAGVHKEAGRGKVWDDRESDRRIGVEPGHGPAIRLRSAPRSATPKAGTIRMTSPDQLSGRENHQTKEMLHLKYTYLVLYCPLTASTPTFLSSQPIDLGNGKDARRSGKFLSVFCCI